MSVRYSKQIDELLDDAERNQQCLARPTNKHLRRALTYRSQDTNTGAIYSPYPGVYARRAYWDGLSPAGKTLHAVRALSHLHPTWIFDGYTAAAIRGWNVPFSLLGKIQIVSPYHYRTDSFAVRTSKYIQYDVLDGIPVTTVTQTLHQCLHAANLRDALPIADSALRQLRLTNADAIRALQNEPSISRWRCSRRTIEIMRLANPLSESGGESFARATMILLGFAIPELQVEYPDPMEPSRMIRADYRWILPDGTVILGEFDGKQKYIDPAMTKGKGTLGALAAERLRESRLTATGARIVRFSYEDVCDLAYFERLLDAFGVPRDRSNPFTNSELLVPPGFRPNEEMPVLSCYEEMPPLTCYEDLIASCDAGR